MTLDEAIKHCEEVADYREHDAQLWDRTGNFWGYNKKDALIEAEECRKCAAEHRQLAKWLRELKERREQPEIIRCKDCKWWGREDTYKDGSSAIVCKKGRSADIEGFCHHAEAMANE